MGKGGKESKRYYSGPKTFHKKKKPWKGPQLIDIKPIELVKPKRLKQPQIDTKFIDEHIRKRKMPGFIDPRGIIIIGMGFHHSMLTAICNIHKEILFIQPIKKEENHAKTIEIQRITTDHNSSD